MRKREQEEFERVFRSAYRSVLQTVSLVLQDRGRAEEVTQDAFLRLYERWGGAVFFEHPAAWVRRVAVRDAKCWDGRSLKPFGLGSGYTSVFPGWTDRVWVLDVEGEPLVILAAHGPRPIRPS